jgi:hypothetical protein
MDADVRGWWVEVAAAESGTQDERTELPRASAAAGTLAFG